MNEEDNLTCPQFGERKEEELWLGFGGKDVPRVSVSRPPCALQERGGQVWKPVSLLIKCLVDFFNLLINFLYFNFLGTGGRLFITQYLAKYFARARYRVMKNCYRNDKIVLKCFGNFNLGMGSKVGTCSCAMASPFFQWFAGPASREPKTLGRVIVNYYLLELIINKRLKLLLILQDWFIIYFNSLASYHFLFNLYFRDRVIFFLKLNKVIWVIVFINTR